MRVSGGIRVFRHETRVLVKDYVECTTVFFFTCCQLNVYDANNYCFKQMTKKSLAEVGPDSKNFSRDFGTCNTLL